jgi:hypothetical protein
MPMKYKLLKNYMDSQIRKIRTAILLMMLMSVITSLAEAQTFNELFRQKATQRKYLIQQIAALKVYLDYLKKGYDIAKKGLDIVGDIKDGNFKSHGEYFGSFKLVSISVKSSSMIASTIAYQNLIITDFRSLLYDIEHTQYLTNEEKKYVSAVYSNMLVLCESELAALTTIISDGQLEMKDDERLGQIEAIYHSMKDKYVFTRSFSNSTKMLIMQRSKEQLEIETSSNILIPPL